MKIVLLTGWTDWEREIALKSASYIEDNLQCDYDKYILPEEIDKFLANYKKYNLAIPVFHGHYWEDGNVFWLLKSIWLKHTFSDSSVHSLCMNKTLTSLVAKNLGIKVPDEILIKNDSDISKISFNFPMIVKPNSWWSSLATNKVNDSEELTNAILEVEKETWDMPLVQEFVEWTEYSVPVVWPSNNPEVLWVMSVSIKDPSVTFFDYDAKYKGWIEKKVEDSSNILVGELSSISVKLYSELWCSWVARPDFLVKDNWDIYFLEINTIPWMSKESFVPKAWRSTWKKDKEFVDNLINIAINEK